MRSERQITHEARLQAIRFLWMCMNRDEEAARWSLERNPFGHGRRKVTLSGVNERQSCPDQPVGLESEA